MAHSHAEVRRLAMAHGLIFGRPDKAASKTVPAYDPAMVRKIEAGQALNVKLAKGAGFSMRSELVYGRVVTRRASTLGKGCWA